MRSSLVSLTLTFAVIGTISAAMAEEKSPSTLPAMKVLPVGSSLHDLRIPRFNKDYETTSVLVAKQMDILAAHKVKGTNVDITIYKDNKPQATTHLDTVFYQDDSGIIHSLENLTISGDSFDIAAQGLILQWENRTGFLLGKTQTLFYSSSDKKMISPVSKPLNKKSLPAVKHKLKPKALAIAVVTFPTLLSAEELTDIDSLAASSTPQIQQVDLKARKDIKKMEHVADSITQTKNALHSQLVTSIGVEPTPATAAVALIPKPEKVPITVNCEKGMYFDAGTGTIVYQKDIMVTHPKYKLTCSDELKIVLKEKPEPPKLDKPAKPDKPQPSKVKTAKVKSSDTVIPNTKNLARFSGLSKAIATGNVVIKSKDKDGKLIITNSETATYDGETGIMILRGGRPTVQQGDTIARVLSDTGYIKILPNMSVRIEGRHEIKANLNELQNN